MRSWRGSFWMDVGWHAWRERLALTVVLRSWGCYLCFEGCRRADGWPRMGVLWCCGDLRMLGSLIDYHSYQAGNILDCQSLNQFYSSKSSNKNSKFFFFLDYSYSSSSSSPLTGTFSFLSYFSYFSYFSSSCSSCRGDSFFYLGEGAASDCSWGCSTDLLRPETS